MGWGLAEHHLARNGLEISVSDGQIAANVWHDISPVAGLAQIQFSEPVRVERANGDIRLTFAKATRLDVRVYPLIPLSSGEGPQRACWSFTKGNDPVGLELHAEVLATGSVILDQKPFLQSLTESLSLNWNSVSVATQLFQRTFATINDAARLLGQLGLDLGKLEWEDNQMVFRNPRMTLVIDSEEIELTADEIRIDGDFNLRYKGPAIRTATSAAVWLFAAPTSPFTLYLPKGTRFDISPSLSRPGVSIVPVDDNPPLLYVPGCAANAPDDSFVLEFRGGEQDEIRVDAEGFVGRAVARPHTVKLGDTLKCVVEEGEADFRRGWYDLRLQAAASLPYFEGASGRLVVESSSKGDFAATWTMQASPRWTDPSGYLQVLEPTAIVKVQRSDGKWTLDGRVGGRLEVLKTAGLLGDAGQWLGDWMQKFSLTFETTLGDLRKLNIADARVSLTPLAWPEDITLWEVFSFEMNEFALRKDGFDIGGDIGFQLAGLSFQGRLPCMQVDLQPGGLTISARRGFSLSGRVTTPGDISGQLELHRVITEHSQELAGTGTLSIPSMPALGITCIFGRRSRDGGGYDPILLLFVQADYPVPLFPGVVLRDIGVGFAVNKVLQGMDGRPEDTLRRLMDDPQGLPDPVRLSAWKTSELGKQDLCLAAASSLAPASNGDGPFPYVGRVISFIRLTGEFVIMFGANLWLFTSLSNAKTREFAARPAMNGAMVLYPRRGLLEMLARTKTSPRMTTPLPILQRAFSIASGEFYLKASRDVLLFRAGPLRVQATIGPVECEGQLLYAVHVGPHGAIALCHASLEGHTGVDWTASFQVGPLSVETGMRLALQLAFESLLAGMVLRHDGPLKDVPAVYGQARVYAAVEIVAWLHLRFELTIKVWRFRKTISWSKRLEADLRLCIDLQVEMLLANTTAIHGRAEVEIRLFGYSFRPVIEVGNRDNKALRAGHEHLNRLLTKGVLV